MADIKVAKPPKKAFNPDRPASDLLKHQVTHLEWAVRHAGERRAGYKVKAVKTEADAAARMAKLIPRLESAARLPFATSEIPDDTVPAGKRRSKKKPKKPARVTSRRTAKKAKQSKRQSSRKSKTRRR